MSKTNSVAWVCVCVGIETVNMSILVMLALNAIYTRLPSSICFMQQLERITALESDPKFLKRQARFRTNIQCFRP